MNFVENYFLIEKNVTIFESSYVVFAATQRNGAVVSYNPLAAPSADRYRQL